MNPKDLARQEFFSGDLWANTNTPPSKAVETFNSAYEYGFKDGYGKAEASAFADGRVAGIADMRKEMGIDQGVYPLVPEPGYEKLVDVLRQAHDHAAKGKGKERHANDLPFHEQRMLSIARLLKSPPDSLAYQVCKKVAEGLTLPEHDRKVAELIGAINYIAGIVILLEEERDKAAKKQWTDTVGPLPDLGATCYCSGGYTGDGPKKTEVVSVNIIVEGNEVTPGDLQEFFDNHFKTKPPKTR